MASMASDEEKPKPFLQELNDDVQRDVNIAMTPLYLVFGALAAISITVLIARKGKTFTGQRLWRS